MITSMVIGRLYEGCSNMNASSSINFLHIYATTKCHTFEF